jgi:alanine dehydrogenase
MDIAIPRALTPGEHRVALTPVGVRTLTDDGNSVFVEQGAGEGAGFSDAAYAEAGAQIAYGPEEVYARGDLLATVDGVPPTALGMVRHGQVVCGFLHLAVAPRRTVAAFASAGASLLSYEQIRREDGILPVLRAMSEICGRMLPQLAAHLLETPSGGRGIMLATSPGIPSAEVVILGAGKVGANAAYGLSAWGVQTTVLDTDVERLRRVEEVCRGHVSTRLSTEATLARVLPYADVLIGSVRVGGPAPKLVSVEMVRLMKPRSVIIDVAIDEGGCVATSRPTTHRNPTYVDHGVLHYAVPNIPSAVARTAAHALNNALLPYVRSVAALGLEAAARVDSSLARGVAMLNGTPRGDTWAERSVGEG